MSLLETTTSDEGSVLAYQKTSHTYTVTRNSPHRRKMEQAGVDYLRRKSQLENPDNLPLVASQDPNKLFAALKEEHDQFHATNKALTKRGRDLLRAIDDGEIDCPHPYDIVYEVLVKHDITYIAFISERRTDPLARCRHEVFYRLRNETPLSLPLIGAICRRDHTTVHHGIRVHEQRLYDGTAV